MFDMALKPYFMSPASKPKLSNPDENQELVKCLKVSKAPCSNGIPNRVLKQLPQRALSLLTQIFNAILHSPLPHYVEARSCDLYPETEEGSSTAFILSAHYSVGHD
jgi:hypothetical protein